MGEILLAGLNESHFPLSAMAAFGLLRICSELEGFREARLSWKEMPLWTAVLHIPAYADIEELLEKLVERQANRGRHEALEFSFTDRLDKMQTGDFEQFVCKAMDEAMSGNWSVAEFAMAYGSEMATQKKDNSFVEPTSFCMASGNQRWFDSVRELAESLVAGKKRSKSQVLEAFRETLLGPWRYQDEFHSLGWDPSREQLHAYTAIAPTKMEKKSVRGALWLAVEALPLFPSVYAGKRLKTAGFHGNDFYFPLWEMPITLSVLRSLLNMPLWHFTRNENGAKKLRAMGVVEVFRSAKTHTGGENGNYFIFRQAEACLGRDARI